MLSSACFCARSSLSARNSGFRSRSANTLKTTQSDGGGIRAAARLYFRGAHFQKVVKFIAGFGFGPARAPDLSVDIHQPSFAGGFITRTAVNAGRGADER